MPLFADRESFAPGLLLIGLGLGLMLIPSVNVVQSSFAEEMQGEISGLSRILSNLGSSLGAAVAGTVLVAGITSTPERSYALGRGRHGRRRRDRVDRRRSPTHGAGPTRRDTILVTRRFVRRS